MRTRRLQSVFSLAWRSFSSVASGLSFTMQWVRKVFNSVHGRFRASEVITSITNPYPSMSRQSRSIIRASCLASCHITALDGICRWHYVSSHGNDVSAPVHAMHVHSDTDSTWLLCNPVNLTSVSSTQRHVFELLCDKVPWYPWKPGGFHPAAHSRKHIIHLSLHTCTHIRLEHLSSTRLHTYILAHVWHTRIHKSFIAHFKPSGPHVWIHTYIYLCILGLPGAHVHT